jgi:hypothetical protein
MYCTYLTSSVERSHSWERNSLSCVHYATRSIIPHSLELASEPRPEVLDFIPKPHTPFANIAYISVLFPCMIRHLFAADFATILKSEYLHTFNMLIIHLHSSARLPTLCGLSVLFITYSGMWFSSSDVQNNIDTIDTKFQCVLFQGSVFITVILLHIRVI